jgi:effector-binding domain-containing protein
MKRKWIIISAVCSIFLIGCAAVGPIMSNVEKPDYKVLSSDQNIQIRQYTPMMLAEIEVKGVRENAVGKGFRLLADYIFGNNTAPDEISAVKGTQQKQNKKIAMTAPVQQQQTGSAWTISFVMPKEYGMETIPKPNNKNIRISLEPSKRFVVIRFSGTYSNENIAKHEKNLIDYVSENKITTTGPPKYAFYNPPWTLPFMRRSEVMFQIAD